ncbi:MAG: NAD(P)/FAD-dependent oxidoreductase [Archangiaceae bacterium]|nr:NAD(P)/FAD-dependent oxidoreductase [Archangiaceae bacterium]
MADFDCDTLVVGSGAGGLAAAVALAQAGQKVQVLEQHEVPGGYLHSFTLGGFTFSPGVHYCGQLGEGGEFRKTLEGLGVAKHVTMLELNRDGYDHVRSGDQRFDFCAGVTPLTERFVQRFPAEREGLADYLGLIEKVRIELLRVGEAHGLLDTLTLPFRTKHMGRYGLYSLQRILEDRVKDPLARALLSVQCGDHGLPPSQVPFALHAAVVGHYLDGGCYPRGGGAAIAKGFVRELQKAGGAVQLKTRVEKLLLEGRRVLGVRLTDGRELRARQVVSNADPLVTYGRFIGAEALPRGLRKKVAGTRMSTGSLGVYLATDLDLRALGLDSGNYWLTRTLDAEATYTRIAQPEIADATECPGLFLSCTTLKDPSSFDGRHHLLEAFTFVPHAVFAKWQGTPPDARPPQYLALRDRLAAQMVALIEEALIPGLRQHLVFQAASSPLTNAHYCEASGGAMYGTAKVRSQIGPWAYGMKSPFENLWLCGASILGQGVHGASLSGVAVAAKMLGLRPSEVLKEKRAALSVLPADDTRAWPVDLLRSMRARQQTRLRASG